MDSDEAAWEFRYELIIAAEEIVDNLADVEMIRCTPKGSSPKQDAFAVLSGNPNDIIHRFVDRALHRGYLASSQATSQYITTVTVCSVTGSLRLDLQFIDAKLSLVNPLEVHVGTNIYVIASHFSSGSYSYHEVFRIDEKDKTGYLPIIYLGTTDAFPGCAMVRINCDIETPSEIIFIPIDKLFVLTMLPIVNMPKPSPKKT